VTARTLQGMARVRPGRLLPDPYLLVWSARRGSRVKCDFACTFTRLFPPVLVVLRSQSRLRLEGWTRTLSGPSPDPTSSVSSLKERGRVMPEGAGPCQTGFYRSFARVPGGCGIPDWPAGLVEVRPGAVVCPVSPIAADLG
jgi:hypothetical protein